LNNLGQKIPAGYGFSTILGDLDFETYSEAGYFFDKVKQKWVGIHGAPKGKKGLGVVGAAVYSEHPTTEIVSLAYNLKDGHGPHLWLPGNAPPYDLLKYIADESREPLEAWNSSFEWYIWNNVAVPMLGWAPLPLHRLACAMAKGKAFGLPGKLGKAAEVIRAGQQKDKGGDKLIQKLSVPRNPTKADKSLRLTPQSNPQDFSSFYQYNLQDIKSEAAVSLLTPDLSPYEREVWLMDQRINTRGVPIDMAGLKACQVILEKATQVYTDELNRITNDQVPTATSFAKLGAWFESRGYGLPNVQGTTCDDALLRNDLPNDVRRVLEIRKYLGSVSVKKVYALLLRTSADGRVRDLFRYYGAERTGRFAGAGVQPQNMPSSGPAVKQCDEINGCGKYFYAGADECPWCGSPGWVTGAAEWGPDAVEDALEAMHTGDLAFVERCFGDAVETIGGCLRGLFCTRKGGEFLVSDYSAIEGVVAAALSGEQWRLDVFHTHGMIYEMSAAMITGVPFQDFINHKKETGNHHPLRKKIGKIAELASGFQGSVGAWKQFGADEFFTDDAEIKAAVDAWRKASPNIVKMWYGLEDAAKNAVRAPGHQYIYNGIKYFVYEGVLYCELLSGRRLVYQKPRLKMDQWPSGQPKEVLIFEGHNSDSTKGPVGWMVFDTYGGKLFENVVQATARDIMVHGMLNIERAGYPIVLHVHDEPAAEVMSGTGSIEEFEALMMSLPGWCAGWPIKAAGGWRGRRYRKD